MFAADSAVELRTCLLAVSDGHFHELADAALVEAGERIVLEDLLVVVRAEELSGVVAREAVRHLSEVVRAEAEELRLVGDLGGGECGARDFDHRADLVVELDLGGLDFVVRHMHYDILDELELLRISRERNHDLRLHAPALMALLRIDRGADDSLRLHHCNFRIRHTETATAVTHHWVDLVQIVDNLLDAGNRLVLCLCKKRNFLFGVRHEFVKRRIEETDCDRLSVKSLEQLLKVILLVRKNLGKGKTALLDRIGADHLAERGDAALGEEHMLCPAKSNTFGAEFTGLAGVARRVGVGAHFQAAELVGPHHDAAEFAGDRRVNGGDDAVVDVAGGSVDGDPVALAERLAAENELLVLLVHLDFLAAGDAALAHAARNDGRMARHAAADGEDALRCLHALDILGARLKTHQNNLLSTSLPSLRVISREYNLSARRARRRWQTASLRCSALEGYGIELRMEKRIEIARLDHENRLLLRAHAFVDKVARNLERSLRRALAVARLEHEELAVLDGELHVLHVAVVLLELFTHFGELLEHLGHYLFHLGDRHRRTHSCHDVLALGVDEELAHELLLARRRIASERHASSGLVVEVAKRHHLYVDRRAPGIRNVVVAAVDVCARVVPTAEHRLNGGEKLLLRVGGEIRADCRLVLSLELGGQFLEIVGRKIDVKLDALLFLHLVDELFEMLLADFHHNVGKHLDEATIAVPSPTRILRLLGERFDDRLVETEIENRIHHARHGCARTGAHRNEKRILRVAELLACGLFELVDVFKHLRLDVVAYLLAIFIVARASFSRNREALRHWET